MPSLEPHPFLEQIVNVQWGGGLAVIFGPQASDAPKESHITHELLATDEFTTARYGQGHYFAVVSRYPKGHATRAEGVAFRFVESWHRLDGAA